MFKPIAKAEFKGNYKGLKHIDADLVKAVNDALESIYGEHDDCCNNYRIENEADLRQQIVEGWIEIDGDKIIVNACM